MKDLFTSVRPRSPRRVLMHVIDAGSEREGPYLLSCARCGYKSGWIAIETRTQAKKGVACPKCKDIRK